MAWKPKEKDLTHEEAIELARKELTPRWIGLPPQFAAIRSDGMKSRIFPLDPDFSKKSWLLHFIDVTRMESQGAIAALKELQRRYEPHGLSPLLVLTPRYGYQTQRQNMETFLRFHQLNLPSVIDLDGMITEAFETNSTPRIILLKQGQVAFNRSTLRELTVAEQEIQNFLRSSDPGLALLRLMKPSVDWVTDQGEVNFFQDRSNPKIKKEGRWQENPGERCLITDDSNASLSFKFQGTSLALLSRVTSALKEPGRISIEIDSAAIFEPNADEDLAFDEEGRSLIRVLDPRLYRVARGLGPGLHRLTLRFPSANQIPVSVYGARFGTSMDPAGGAAGKD